MGENRQKQIHTYGVHKEAMIFDKWVNKTLGKNCDDLIGSFLKSTALSENDFTKMFCTPIEGDILVFVDKKCIAYNNLSNDNKIYSLECVDGKVKYCTNRYKGLKYLLRAKRCMRESTDIYSKPSMSAHISGKTNDEILILELDYSKKWARIGKNEWVSYSQIKKLGE